MTFPSGPALPGPLHLPSGLNVGEAFARILAHQGAVMLHHAARITHGGADPEPVHQTRVALRRLRSALAVFRAATGTPATAELGRDLRALGHMLGPARAWDVFLAETGERLRRAFPDDAALVKLLDGATRKRDAAYGALARERAGPHFSRLTTHLTAVADGLGWRDELQPEQRALLLTPLEQYGADTLTRLHTRVRRAGKGIKALDIAALHALRLRGKRLRYAAEFFSAQFDTKSSNRFIRRLAALQEQLGVLNDATATAGLMAALRARGHAGGVALGFTMAESEAARRHLPKVWKRFRRAAPFWPDMPAREMPAPEMPAPDVPDKGRTEPPQETGPP